MKYLGGTISKRNNVGGWMHPTDDFVAVVYIVIVIAAATAFVNLLQTDLGVPRPGAILTIWFDSHPCIADRIEFCNRYQPWETGQPSKYEEYMNP